MKRIDFPLRPHLSKYLQVTLGLARVSDGQLQVDDYVLSTTDKFGFALSFLLRKPVKSTRHQASATDCTAALGVNLRNFNYPHWALSQGQLEPWAVFKFNEFVEDEFRTDLYLWVGKLVERGTTVKEAILTYMVFLGISEEELAFETLRKDVQRNAGLQTPRTKKKEPKSKNFSVNLSREIGGLSPKSGAVSRESGVLSQRDTWDAVRQELSKLPPSLFELDFFRRHDRAA